MKLRELIAALLGGNLDDEVVIQVSERNHHNVLVEYKTVPISYVMTTKRNGQPTIAIENKELQEAEWSNE